jgi:UDP-N-acetylmuramate--alanine ligase
MAAAILRAGGLDPTVVVGALWDNLGSNAVLGRGDYFVAEADESDGSFLFLKPQITVLTNLDREHLDFYRDLSHIQETFRRYLEQLPPGSRLVACGDDAHLRAVLGDVSHPCLTYSLESGADFRAGDIQPQGLGCRFRLQVHGQDQGWVTLPLTGKHYVLNAMAACAVAQTLGLEAPVWREGLAALGQIHRRCQVKGETQGVLVLDDYGHHPTEIRTTLNALAQAFGQRRLVVAFQPHRYSRTRALLEEFFPVFEPAGLVFVTEIYGAGEPPVPGLSGRAVCDGIRRRGHPAVHFVEDKAACAARLLDYLRPGDVLLTLGAGDIWQTGEELLARLAGRPPTA